MKKTILLSLIFFMSIGMSACVKKDKTVESKQKVLESNQKEEKVAETNENMTILDWLKGGKTVQCVVKSPEGDIITTTKNESVRVEGIPYYSMDSSGEMPQTNNGAMLTVGDWTYSWDKVSKKGTKMNVKEMEESYSDDEEESYYDDNEDWDDMAEEWEESEFEYDCKEVKADNALFEVPKDVEFKDLTQMMNGYAEIGNTMKEQAENGEEIDMEELQRMMEEFQQ